ncbi:hypothetical protein GCM10027285_20430 [Oleiagrimonas citrea]|jgi:hypothetical protein|uniref:Glyoxalase n=1 Tax=Oleiagrimonas citrea TaxID=1665687 RepID=A0A846ZJ74_9GAMM|nr:glyoxalase [Oleiagrimonas citrea]
MIDHVDFAVSDPARSRALDAQVLTAGGVDCGTPGLRTRYHAHYYAAYALDPVGHVIKAVCHHPH